MFRQRTVGETKSLHGAIFIGDVDDTTGIHRIKAEVSHRNRNVGSDPYRSTRPMEAYPRHVEHLPCANRLRCAPPCNFASAKLDTIVISVVSRGRGGCRRSDLRVREIGILLLRNKTSNLI